MRKIYSTEEFNEFNVDPTDGITEVDLIRDEADQEEGLQDIQSVVNAMEELRDVVLAIESHSDYPVYEAKRRVDRALNKVGLRPESNVSLESINSVSNEVAMESVMQTVVNGFKRLTNYAVRIQDFIENKVLWGFKNLKEIISMLNRDIQKAEQAANGLSNKSAGRFNPNKNIRQYLRTKDGKPLSFKDTKEILVNHIEVLESFLGQKEIVSILHGEDLDDYQGLMDKALKGSKEDQKKVNDINNHQVKQLASIFKSFREFSGRPLADGKTLYIEFDEDAADNFQHHHDFFQINVINNPSQSMPLEAEALTISEAKEIVKLAQKLRSLYKKSDDWSKNITFIRQKIRVLRQFGQYVLPTVGLVLGPIKVVLAAGIGIAIGIYSILKLVKLISYTSSSLSYYAIREACNYIQASARV